MLEHGGTQIKNRKTRTLYRLMRPIVKLKIGFKKLTVPINSLSEEDKK